jgi:hypothetical protein
MAKYGGPQRYSHRYRASPVESIRLTYKVSARIKPTTGMTTAQSPGDRDYHSAHRRNPRGGTLRGPSRLELWRRWCPAQSSSAIKSGQSDRHPVTTTRPGEDAYIVGGSSSPDEGVFDGQHRQDATEGSAHVGRTPRRADSDRRCRWCRCGGRACVGAGRQLIDI